MLRKSIFFASTKQKAGVKMKESGFAKLKKTVLMKNTYVEAGIVAVASPLPLMIFTSMWSVLFGIGFGIGVLGYTSIPEWMLYISLFPLLISPAIGVLGTVRCLLKIKEKKAWLGLILSLLGLVENMLLFYGCFYIGSRY